MKKKQTVDGVLQAISKSIDQLDEVKTNNNNEAGNLGNQIEALNAKKQSAENEAERADRVKTRLEELLS